MRAVTFDDIVTGCRVEIAAESGRLVVVAGRKVLSRSDEVIAWTTDDPLVQITRGNFVGFAQRTLGKGQ
jgi:hypothetical protein